MKELSIEEKARRYDEAYKKVAIRFGSNVADEIFPELKESEDERIKNIIKNSLRAYFEGKLGTGTNDTDYAECFSWLEKQEPVDEDEIVKGIRRSVAISLMNHIDANSKGMCLSNMECEDIENAIVNEDWNKVYGYMKKKLERQGEQKPANKAKPKFKVGDKIVEDNEFGMVGGEITDIDITHYELDGGDRYIPISHQDNYKLVEEQKSAWSEEDENGFGDALWAIQQAKTIAKNENDMGNLWCAERFLNSIKDRLQSQPKQTWKPSEEMLEALYKAIPENVMEISEDEMLLNKLYQGLKYGRVLSKN